MMWCGSGSRLNGIDPRPVKIFRENGLQHLVNEVGVGQLVYGTDYPFDWPVGVDFILNAKFLSNAEKEAILGGNLIRLLRLAT